MGLWWSYGITDCPVGKKAVVKSQNHYVYYWCLAFKASLRVGVTSSGPTVVVSMSLMQTRAPLIKPGFLIHSVFLYFYLGASYASRIGYITFGSK